MKYTLLITQECNLACPYCYINKRPLKMTLDVAGKVVDFIFNNTPHGEKIDIGFFGGEPLLEFGLVKEITSVIENHPQYQDFHVEISLVTNGTIFSEEIAEFINQHNICFCLSCDGPSIVQDESRYFKVGGGSSTIVENTIKQAVKSLPVVLVNAVYSPKNFRFLPQVIEYFSSLGLRRIYLNPDFSANWTKQDSKEIIEVYRHIAQIYIDSYLLKKPLFISLLDGKIAVMLRGGYRSEERCHMGKKEFAFTPEGNIFPCERLVGDGTAENCHCIGHVDTYLQLDKITCNLYPHEKINKECISCGLRDYCMNWCGCSNYHSSGYYNRVGAFLCASERAAIQVAMNVFQVLERELGATFFEHLAGKPALNTALTAI